MFRLFRLLLAIAFFRLCTALPEKSIWAWRVTSLSETALQKSMLKNSNVFVELYCRTSSTISIKWIFLQSPCIEMFVGLNASVILNELENEHPFPQPTSYKTNQMTIKCEATTTHFLKTSDEIIVNADPVHEEYSNVGTLSRAIASDVQGLLTKTWADGAHLLVLKIKCTQPECNSDLDVRVEMRNSDGSYLSAVEYPFLPFNSLMSVLYFCFVILWLVLIISYWHMVMRIQFYIGLVLVLGLWEHLILTAIYGTLQNTGMVSNSAAYFAELIACFKRTLARLLVLIVCLGYGVTKPRLGKIWFRRCLAIGSVYFILVTMEGMARVHYPRFHTTRFILATLIPLMCLDAAIMWWIFIYLARTLRETRVRQNLVKHKLYRNFSYVLLAVSVVSVVFMLWSVMAFKRQACIENWHYLWIDDAFWQALFLVILGVIIILWRPSSSNEEYAYSLLDAQSTNENDDGDEDEEVMLDHLGQENNGLSTVRTRTTGDTEAENESSAVIQPDNSRFVPPGIKPSIVERLGIEAASGPGEQQPVWKVD